MFQNPPIPPLPSANADFDSPLSAFERGAVRDAVELEFERAIVEAQEFRGLQVSAEEQQRLRVAVVPTVFLNFMQLSGNLNVRELSEGECRILQREMTTELHKELTR